MSRGEQSGTHAVRRKGESGRGGVHAWDSLGRTPVHQYSFRWKRLLVIAGVSFRRFQGIEFLEVLQGSIGWRLLIILNRFRAHRSKLVCRHIQARRSAIALQYVPGYAPAFHTVEYIWESLKCGAMVNLRARGLVVPAYRAVRHARSMRRRSALVTVWRRQTELFWRCHVVTQASIGPQNSLARRFSSYGNREMGSAP